MNTSIIIDDIRRRSIRVQRDKILERIRQEEEIATTTLPRKIIREAEERARERVALQGWKRHLAFIAVILGVGYVIYRILGNRQRLVRPRVKSTSFAIQTEGIDENTGNAKRAVSFESEKDWKLERFKLEHPMTWKQFERDGQPDWLVSDVSGRLSFDFFNTELKLAIDVINKDMLRFPSPGYFETQEEFENSVYNRKLKSELSSANSFSYKTIVVNSDTRVYT